MLFLGASISITAFPMLARIIYERGLTGTSLGTLALAAGAIDDAAAWCVLAIVLASFGEGARVAVIAIAGGMAYALFLANVDLDRIPIVLVSGAVPLREIAARVGTPYRLAKPYSIDALQALVDRALRELTAPHPDHAAFLGAAALRVK